MIAYQRDDRVFVAPHGDGPSGNATVTGIGTDGIGLPIVHVRLDEYCTATAGRMAGKAADGRDWRVWTVDAADVRLLERAA